MIRSRTPLPLLLFILLVFSVGVAFGAGAPQKVIPQSRKKWTFMLFMAADNNLEGGTSIDINELETIGSTKDVNFVVQLDRIGRFSEDSELTWGGTRRFYVLPDKDPLKMTSPMLEDLGEEA